MNTHDTPSIPVLIARATIEMFVRSGKIPSAEDLPPFGTSVAGCFVSLHRQGELRGCIGTILPTKENIRAEIIRNAVSACSDDPRFDPVSPQELEDLEIHVDILDTPQPVSSVQELDPHKYGVIVTSGIKRGLLLPDLAGVDSVEEQLAIACRKASISPQEHYSMERFTVTRYS